MNVEMNDVWVPSAHGLSTNCDSTLFHITSTDFFSVMSTTLAIILITIKFLYVFFYCCRVKTKSEPEQTVPEAETLLSKNLKKRHVK